MPDLRQSFLPLPQANAVVSDFLSKRRSNLARNMSGPGPTEDELDAILMTAARVPDHRKLSPWRFIVIKGTARERLGDTLRAIYEREHPGLPEDRYRFEAERLTRAPVVVAVISAPVMCTKGTPAWEQELSVGAVCMKMLLAAQSRGYGAQWLTEWFAYDATFLEALSLGDGERVAGFIHIGNVEEASAERPRPDMGEIVSVIDA